MNTKQFPGNGSYPCLGVKLKLRLKTAFTIAFILVSFSHLFSQVGISTTAITPNSSSILELRSTTLGFLPPRMATTERDAISTPATGLVIYNTTTNLLNFYNGSSWQITSTGTGTVSSVSVVSANGFAGTVATATTTPAITISTSVSGILKGNGTAISAATAGTDYQVPITTGDVTTSGATATIANSAVTLAKMANMATASLIYRKTAGSGAPEVNTLATLKTDLGLTGTNSGDQTITLTGDVTGSGTGSFATTIGAGKVTNTMLAGSISLTTKVTGTLPIANGGTNSTATPTNGGIAYGDGTAIQYSTAGTQGQVLTSNGASAPTWKDSRTIVELASDVVNNNATANTIADVTGLSFAVTAGTIYRFKATIYYTSASTNTGSRWSVSGPASPTFLSYSSNYSLTATTQTLNNLSAYDLPANSNANSLTNSIAEITGIIKPSANGTVIIRFASEVSNSAITAKAGSTLEWW